MYCKIYDAITGFREINDGEKPKLIVLGHNVLYKTLSERNYHQHMAVTRDGEYTFEGIRVIESIRNDELSLF